MSKRTPSGAISIRTCKRHGLVGVAVVVDGALGLVDARRERAISARVRRSVYSSSSSIVARSVSRPWRPDERRDAPDAGRVRRDLGAEVAGRLVLRADLGQDQPEDVVHDRPALDELDRRDDHALLEHLLEGADRRGRAAADVDVVREVRDVAEQLAVDVDRRDQADVVQVHAARVRVVRDDHVARARGSRRRSARIACGTCSTIEPRCTGCVNACATERSSASKNAHEKSERVLMFVE